MLDRLVVGDSSVGKQNYLNQQVDMKDHKQHRRDQEEAVDWQVHAESGKLDGLVKEKRIVRYSAGCDN